VLLVEDDKTARRAIALLLKRQGFAVSEATTVAEAMQGIVRGPDWTLLDLMLPDGSGLDVLRTIRSEGLRMRVCVISGCHEHVLEQAREMGADCALAKPLDVNRLLEVLGRR
jgi:DNA-binding response OmpR family regulator